MVKLDQVSKEYDNFEDCTHLISSINNDFKTMKYELQRLICDRDHAQILVTTKEVVLEVIPSMFMYFKINVLGKEPPVRLHITYSPGQSISQNPRQKLKRVDLRLFYSSHENLVEPNDKYH